MDINARLDGVYGLSDAWALDLRAGWSAASAKMSSGDLDIGGPGFNAMRFPEVNEDVDRISFGGAYNFSDRMRVALDWFSVIDGRNTSDFDALAATFTYGFDAYRP